MTRQEAVELLTRIRDYKRLTLYEWLDVEKEALNMGIDALEQEPNWVGTPQEFAKKMSQLAESGDPEADHIKADELMCQLLTSLGYGKGVKIFREMYKWYS